MPVDRTPIQWPRPRDGQARLMLLGSPHLANPGNDEHNLDVDDTLASARQEELVVVRERLQQGRFDHVAVEIPRNLQSGLDDQYAAVQEGTPLDDETALPAGPARIRGEAVQIGCRLAAHLGHDRVMAVDSHPDPPASEMDWAIDVDPETVPYPLPDMEGAVETMEQRLRELPLLEVLREYNGATHLRRLQAGNIAAALSSSDGESHVGARQVGFWYERNARVLENLRRVTGADERTLFVCGASHVIPVKQLAQAAPATCPESPLSLLD